MNQGNRRTGGTYINGQGGNLDLFGRVRVSVPETRFEYANQYNKGPLVWGELVSGGGVATHNPNRASVTLSTGVGGSIKRQTLKYLRYRPGRAMLADMTFVLGAKPTAGYKRVGLFDDGDGVFLEYNPLGLCIVQRTSVSGSPVETRYYQRDWNLDPMNGQGISGMFFDPTMAQVMQIGLGWLGVEGWTVSFAYQNQVFPVHMVDYANKTDVVYQKTANLPARYEIAEGGASTMEQICTAVFSESADDQEEYYTHTAFRTTAAAVTSRRPVVSIRPKLTYEGQSNRGLLVPESISILASADATYELVWDGALTGASWVDLGSNSIAEADYSATAISGGEVADSGLIGATVQARSPVESIARGRYPVVLAPDGLSSYPFSIVCTSHTGTSNIRAAITFREYY